MKKFLFTILILIAVIVTGELMSNPKTIIAQRDRQNVWSVNHFFNMYKTEYLGPINDTTLVTIIDKEMINHKPMVRVTDGNTVTLLTSKEVYDYVEPDDTVNLVITHEPITKHKYRTKYFVYK